MQFELSCCGDDRAAVFPIRNGLAIALADGAGGTSYGARAAQAVIDAVGAAAAAGEPFDIPALLESLDASPARLGGGQTTAVVLTVTHSGIMGASVGDSGAWLVGDTVVDLTEHQRRKPLLGDGATVTPFEAAQLGDRMLLVASDGLLRYLPPARIAELARGSDLADAVRTLVAETRAANGPDDISVALYRARPGATIASRAGRARTSLLGLSIGDAFGEALASEPDRAAQRTRLRLLPTRRPWRWTDDTAMALSIVEILEEHGTIDGDALVASFARRWTEQPHRGYGHGTATILQRVAAGASWREEARRAFGGRGSVGNGAAMRAAPIGAFFADDLARAAAEAERSGITTHAHPDGVAGAIAIGVAAALVASGADRATLLADVMSVTPSGHTRAGIRRAVALGLDADLRRAAAELGVGLDVAAHDTVPFALWVAARHLACFEDALWDATAFDGDRDTLGAIVGGIVVLATGIDAIPVLWRTATEALPD